MAAHCVVRSGGSSAAAATGAVASGTDAQRGITLIESLIALAIIAAGVLGITMMLVNGMAQQRTAATQSAANTLLADGLETLQVAQLLPPVTAATDIAAWRARVATQLPAGTAGAAATSIAPQVLTDGSDAQALQLSFASTGRGTDSALNALVVTTVWPLGGP
jgi:Tfp pilus assembly protein PilV